MSAAKHTPGPWTLQRNVTNYRSGAKSLQVRSPDDELIATFPGRPCDAANSALVKAAPDLLEALEELHEFFATIGSQADDAGHKHVMKKAAAAIAKATGAAS